MDKWFHPTLYWACDYLYMLRLKLIHVSKRGPAVNKQSHILTYWGQDKMADTLQIIFKFISLNEHGQFSPKYSRSSSVRARYGVSFVGSASDWYSASVPAMTCAISCYIGPCYNGTRLYVSLGLDLFKIYNHKTGYILDTFWTEYIQRENKFFEKKKNFS